MKIRTTFKNGELTIVHTFVVDAANIEEAIEAAKSRYPTWELVKLQSLES
jgi:hypothetical protein